MRATGSIDEWMRFLDATSTDDAEGAIAAQVRRLDHVYNELSACVAKLWDCPMVEIPDAILIGRTSLAEAMSLLEHVSVRLQSEEAGAA